MITIDRVYRIDIGGGKVSLTEAEAVELRDVLIQHFPLPVVELAPVASTDPRMTTEEGYILFQEK